MPLTPAERTLRAQIAAHESWACTEDRSARTAAARRAHDAKFEQQVDPDGKLSPAERAIRAEHARKAHFKRLAFRSAQARKRKAAVAVRIAEQLDARVLPQSAHCDLGLVDDDGLVGAEAS